MKTDIEIAQAAELRPIQEIAAKIGLGPDDIVRGEWVFDKPFFIIVNLALGGTLGGSIEPDLEYPIQYYVDYVRVYQAVSGQGDG